MLPPRSLLAALSSLFWSRGPRQPAARRWATARGTLWSTWSLLERQLKYTRLSGLSGQAGDERGSGIRKCSSLLFKEVKSVRAARLQITDRRAWQQLQAVIKTSRSKQPHIYLKATAACHTYIPPCMCPRRGRMLSWLMTCGTGSDQLSKKLTSNSIGWNVISVNA